jgi:acetyl-CoA carboxylase beta subunit
MKPSKIEDQHILEHELNCRLQKLEAQQRATAEAEKRRLKELHWMHCPKCGQALTTETYGSVEVDVCPSCRGLWLDANELETIIASESGLFRSCLKIIRRR